VSLQTFCRFASVMLALLPATMPAQQSGRPTVAVLPFNIVSLSRTVDGKALADALAGMIMTELSAKSAIQVVDRQLVQDLLTRQKLLVSGRVTEEDALRAGKLLGAQYIVTGSAVLDAKTARLDIRIVDSETGAPARPPFKKTGEQDDLLSIVQDLANDFTQDLKLPNRAAMIADFHVPVAASLTYSRGLDYETRGKKDLARQMYLKTLELAPNHAAAKAALERVR
jgi:TolB-like protein